MIVGERPKTNVSLATNHVPAWTPNCSAADSPPSALALECKSSMESVNKQSFSLPKWKLNQQLTFGMSIACLENRTKKRKARQYSIGATKEIAGLHRSSRTTKSSNSL
jgi:hypothetical protein